MHKLRFKKSNRNARNTLKQCFSIKYDDNFFKLDLTTMMKFEKLEKRVLEMSTK